MSHEVIAWDVLAGIGVATIRSGRSGKLYTVTSKAGRDTCTCEAGRREYGCSHVRALREHLLHADPAAGGGTAACAPGEAPSPAVEPPPASPDPFARIRRAQDATDDPAARRRLVGNGRERVS